MLLRTFLAPLIHPRRALRGLRNYIWYWRNWCQYRRLPGSEPLSLRNAYPFLYDRTEFTPYDPHYFYQGIWACKAIRESGAPQHVDVGSDVGVVGMLTAITCVTFIDIRPLQAQVENLVSRAGSILALPFPDNAVPSLSCLHVAEHIGLGRYGDPLDPRGTQKATRELARVLAPGGQLCFSVPVGKPRVCFNAHRIHAPRQILDYFYDLRLVRFAGVDDASVFRQGLQPDDLADQSYACGLFLFTKERSTTTR